MTPQKKMDEEQYKTIKAYLIGSIATTVAMASMFIGTYIMTNQRIDDVVRETRELYKQNSQMLIEIKEHDYRLSGLEQKIDKQMNK